MGECSTDAAEFVELPCQCTLAYCNRCRHSLLARSFNTSGKARCPSCDIPVRIEFDAASRQLRFLHEAAVETPESSEETVRRWREEVKDVQVEMLRDYGERSASEDEGITPLCVCGSALIKITAFERASRWAHQMLR